MNVKMLLSLAAGAAMLNATAGVVGDVLKPYVENGQLPGAISIIYNNGAEEIDCVGYADPPVRDHMIACLDSLLLDAGIVG